MVRTALGGVILAVLLFWAAGSYGLTSPFYYGHYGYHGGSYATWARGTLRHKTVYAVNEPGFAPPRPASYYVHHPQLPHHLVAVSFALTGEHEWSVRLAALASAFASLLLVAAIAWRHIGPLPAAAAALTFAIVPVNVWFSVNMDQGFPSIACLLAFFWFYLAWLADGRWRNGGAALAFQALAGGFEWSPYFAFPIIFVHVVVTGLRRRGRYLTFAALSPLAALLPLATHAFLVWRAELIDDIFAAYRNRAGTVGYRSFLEGMGRYGEILFGKVLLVAMFAWLLWALVRAARGRGRSVDLVGVAFAGSVLIYMHVFKIAIITHAYRQLYGNVWAAFAVASVVAAASRLAVALGGPRQAEPPNRQQARRTTALATAAGLGCALVLLGATVPVAWAGLKESRLHGGVPNWKTFNPDLRQTAFANQVLQRTRPSDVIYFHPSFAHPPPTRMDWAFYYDRDLARGALLDRFVHADRGTYRPGVIVLVPRLLSGVELRAYAELAVKHPILRVDDLALVDLRIEDAKLEVYRTAPPDRSHTSALRRWLEGPYPLPDLVEDAEAADAERALLTAARAPAPGPAPAREPSTGGPPAARRKPRSDKPDARPAAAYDQAGRTRWPASTSRKSKKP